MYVDLPLSGSKRLALEKDISKFPTNRSRLYNKENDKLLTRLL